MILAVFVLLLIGGAETSWVSFKDKGIVSIITATLVIFILLTLGVVLICSSLLAKEDTDNYRAGEGYKEEDYDKVFELSESVEFYNTVAGFYDQRNTDNYRNTYDLIYSLCKLHVENLFKVKVCDLGGGTGALFRKFKHRNNVHWTVIDLAFNALNIFNTNYSNNDNVQSREFNITTNLYQNSNEKFDIVILSFVLSSLDVNFPFNKLKEIMSPSGVLIIADNHPNYSNGTLYGFQRIEGKSYALKIKPIEPLDLKQQVENQGFTQKEIKFSHTNKDNILYSHVQVYGHTQPDY